MPDTPLYLVEIRYNVRIPVRDGLELSANLFMPAPREPDEKFPALLEMIPYRKDDWRYIADHQRMTYFAQRGYVGCRLDIRGTGSSPGLALDEYTRAETQDGYDAVEWLAAQPWCNGNVGMWGISYGGDTSVLPDGTSLSTSEMIELTAYHHDPAHARLYNEVNYHLKERGYETHVRSTGTIRSTGTDFHADVELLVTLNGNIFFQKSWLETIPRRLL